uniref:Uncharacterized protein n=1 Tax=Leucosporidium scottii TaxID=5278 RepID=A0A0H5FU37_9BASI|nr:hypothetical protein ls5930a1_00017 [Leucosporidium scottii]
MGKKPTAQAKKKGKVSNPFEGDLLSPGTSVQWSEKQHQQHDAVQAPSALYATAGHKHHKGKKHELHYAQDYEEELAAEEGYYDEHFELDERRGRSTRPRLLWRSHLDALTLGVLDSHVVEVRGTKVPRLMGEGSVEGKKWSRELEKCGL